MTLTCIIGQPSSLSCAPFLHHDHYQESTMNTRKNLQIDQIEIEPFVLQNQDDGKWLLKCLRESALYSIPHTRKISNRFIRKQMIDEGKNILRQCDHVNLSILIAKDKTLGNLGYIILDFSAIEGSTGEKQVYVQDLYVDPGYWGSPVVHQLIDICKRKARERGFKYITCDISCNNRRSLLKAQRLGFQKERIQLVMWADETLSKEDRLRDDNENYYLRSRKRPSK